MLIHTRRLPPSDLTAIKRLIARLPENHELIEKLEEKQYQLNAGYSGELDVDRTLNEIEFPRDTIILKDVTLQINPHYSLQIDTLILTKTLAIILEIKKYAGTIHFDEQSGKTTKIAPDGTIEQYDCIIHQLIRAKEGLRQWLKNRNFNLQIEEVLVMANQRTIIAEMPNSVPIKYRKQLPRYIRELLDQPNSLSSVEIKTVAAQIKQHQASIKRRLACEKYKIHPATLTKGVLCLACNSPMKRTQGRKWHCQVCEKYGDRELAQSLVDWFLLISPTITNGECREFLQLRSKSAASVILRESKLKKRGNPPASSYTWDYKSRLFMNKYRK